MHAKASRFLLQRSALATALAALLTPYVSQAQVGPNLTVSNTDSGDAAKKTVRTMTKVEVHGDNGYQVEKSANPKHVKPLLDTPQTITVINEAVLREQGAGSLMDALRNTPGITQQLGEGGSTTAGDAFMMRGFSTETATFVDGVRDLGAISRDVFNLEQVEVVKGPAGADIGRGAASGYISLFSKLPKLVAATSGSFSLGSEGQHRLTLDHNSPIGSSAAVRLNVMAQGGEVAGRHLVENKGHALAPSFALGLGTDTRAFLYSLHVRQDNRPDGGISTIGMPGYFSSNPALLAGARINPENYYGSRHDKETVNADMASVKVEHDFDEDTRLHNLSRIGRTEMERVLTSIGGVTATDPANPSSWTVSRSRQRVDRDNEVLANQTQLTTVFSTGSAKHTFAAGIEFIYEREKNKGFASSAQTINGVPFPAISNPPANLYAPNPDDPLGIPYATGAFTDGNTRTLAAYLMDSIDLSTRWQLTAGMRLERYATRTNSLNLVTSRSLPSFPGYSIGQLAPLSLEDSDTLLSWKLGALYKPTANGSVYAAIGNSLSPPGGGNFALSSSATSASHPAMVPQETTNLELGSKWSLLGERLSLTGALFRTENDKQVSYNEDTQSYTQFGKTRVEGLELAAVGQLTRFWQLTAGLAKTRTFALDQYSNWNGAISETDGVRWSPDLTATLWSSYTIHRFTLGGGLRYVSEQKRVTTRGANPSLTNMPSIPAYATADLMAAFAVNKHLNLRLNIYNLTDKLYLRTLNNNGSRMQLGAPRTAQLTAEVRF